jgi:hypothetical protein
MLVSKIVLAMPVLLSFGRRFRVRRASRGRSGRGIRGDHGTTNHASATDWD